ncbi:MAG: lysylphosphatidylglycerol synthase transmembrane domain-containing protein [Geminicoccaceae bacterium]|nr:lysylphosphatidylglycerol synthase transmembrane domain-containing protein [Geminicoccaceae bacterium]
MLRLGLSATLLLAVLALVPLGEVAAVLGRVDPWLAAAGFALVIPKLLASGLRMLALVRIQGLRVGLGGLIALNLATSFYALFLPGHLAAGALRWYRLARAEGRPAAALAVVGFSRLIELEVTLALGLTFWAFDAQARALHAWPALLAALALAACLGAHLAGPMLAERLPERGLRLGDRLARLSTALAAARAVLARFGGLSWRAQASAVGYSALTQVLGILTALLFAWALGSEISVAALVWVRSLMAVALLLPVGWAGVGVREVSLALLLTPFGVPAAEALALGILLSLRALLAGAMGGVVEAFGLVRLPPAPATTATVG